MANFYFSKMMNFRFSLPKSPMTGKIDTFILDGIIDDLYWDSF